MLRYFVVLSILIHIVPASLMAAPDTVEVREVGQLVMENIPRGIEWQGRAVSRHMRTEDSYRVIGWSEKGGSLLFLRRGNIYKSKGHRSRYTKLLDFEVPIHNPQVAKFCGKPGYVFTSYQDGDEYAAVYATQSKAFKPSQLSTGVAINRSLKVSDQQDLLAYASAKKNSGIWRLIVQDICEGSWLRTLYEGEEPLYPRDFHPDGASLLASTTEGGADLLYEYDVTEGTRRLLISEQGRIRQSVYSADGRYIFYTTNHTTDFIELYRLDRQSGEITTVISDVGLDIEKIKLSADRTRMAVSFNYLGFSKLLVIDPERLKALTSNLSESLGVVSSLHFSSDGQKLALSLSQPTVPARSGVYDYMANRFTPWTGGFSRGQKITDLVPEVTTYPAHDIVEGKKRRIPVMLYTPSSATADKPVPVVIVAHGGPASQARPAFSRFYHYLTTKMGVAVVRPNIRGSTGYGVSFEQLDQTYKRPDAIMDIGSLLEWVGKNPKLDPSRIVIMGGSYGGYVALASLVAYPDRFKGGISRVGITDFETFLQNTERYRVNNRRREYGDERDPDMVEFFKQISPLHNLSKITAPVLLIQGNNDPRVPAQQARDMVDRMRANGLSVSYLLAKNEGHRFTKPQNRLAATGAQLMFLRQVLFGE